MPDSLRILSPAKINLTLNVLGKRPDGFHEIETLFERISLFDRIRLKKTKGPLRLHTRSSLVPHGPENLALRAAILLKHSSAVKSGADIFLDKAIPVGAGLGGGSSNAASVLLGLNRLWNLNLSQKKLRKLGASLGSDVPFFLLNTAWAIGRGRGEKLKSVKLPRCRLWHCVIKPSFGISTKDAYGNLKVRALTPQKGNVRMLVRSLKKRKFFGLHNLLKNNLERALNKRLRAILELKKELIKNGASAALMSGSGSCVFGIYDSKTSAEKAAKNLKKNRSLQVFVVSTY